MNPPFDTSLFGAMQETYIPASFAVSKQATVAGIEHDVRTILKKNRSGRTGLIALNTLTKGENMMSYPSFARPCRRFTIPNVRILAEMFELLGADFRIVVMVRNSHQIIRSVVDHRHFYADAAQASSMFTDVLEEVLRQLGRLDKHFFTYIDYDELPSVPNDFTVWLGLNGLFDVQNALSRTYHRPLSDNTHQASSKPSKSFVEADFKLRAFLTQAPIA
jgi:hypothetical protein